VPTAQDGAPAAQEAAAAVKSFVVAAAAGAGWGGGRQCWQVQQLGALHGLRWSIYGCARGGSGVTDSSKKGQRHAHSNMARVLTRHACCGAAIAAVAVVLL
jgi:hypothetical protein